MGAQSMADETIADFSKGETVEWRTVNDNVMGGRSIGDFEVDDNKLLFKGRTNTNGGGFSSIRASAQSLDLEGATGFRLKIKGCLLYTSPSPRDLSTSRMPSSA